MDEKKVWGIHTRDSRLFLEKNVIGIGWKELGNLTNIPPSRDGFKNVIVSLFEGMTKQAVASAAGMPFRFLHEMQIGDYVIHPSKMTREINIGIIESDYFYNDKEPEYAQQRKVKWIKVLPRTSFSQGALYELGSAMTLFSIRNYADEFLAALDKNFKAKDIAIDENEFIASSSEEIEESTNDFILKELSKNYKGYDLERLILNLLEAMGYRAELSKRGGDRGVDITAYKDELPPRIIVQVKSQDSNITENAIQSLKGAMREGDYGVFITLSSYTKNALRYLHETPIIRGIDGAGLSSLIRKYYDKLNNDHKRLIPLKMVYIPDLSK